MSGIKKKQFRFRIPWISGSCSTRSPRSKSSSQLVYAPTISEPQTTVDRKQMFAVATSNPSESNIKLAAVPVTTNVSNSPMSMNDEVTNVVNRVASVNPTTLLPTDDKAVSIVTLAGDNRGATMHVAGSQSQSTRKKASIHNIHRTNKEEDKDEAGKAYVNSNIQSMNNSFMIQGSVTGRDPGVRVILPQQPQPEPQVSRVEKLTYQPVVRRRCLRGLMVEPSDSDPENPDKPRRHGCKFSCGDVRKDKEKVIQ